MADNQNLVEDIFHHKCTTYSTQLDLPIVSDDEESIFEAPDVEMNNTTSPSPTVLDPEVNLQDKNINDVPISQMIINQLHQQQNYYSITIALIIAHSRNFISWLSFD